MNKDDNMQTATLTKNLNINIPKPFRNSFKENGFVSGQEFQIFFYNDRIELLPLKNMKEMRGYLKGIDANIIREDDRL